MVCRLPAAQQSLPCPTVIPRHIPDTNSAPRNLAAQTETLQITRWRGQAGLVSSLDVEQAVAASEQTAAQIPALQTGIAQALNSLAVLTGQAPGALQSRLSNMQ